tara:strand:- start:1509 stop:1688 length:180 start_codon:yes stop_codon:yes gene_type:complete
MEEVKIPKRLKYHFEKQLAHAKEMVEHNILNHKERVNWERWVKHLSRKLKKLNLQHKDT